jgi:hypothetical protein
MFDLELNIEGWKRALLAREAMLAEHVDELEDHLREEMARLRALSLSDEESFFVARRRVGDVDALAVEYAKVVGRGTRRGELQWMLLGFALLAAFCTVLEGASIWTYVKFARYGVLAAFSAGIAASAIPLSMVLWAACRAARGRSSAALFSWLTRPHLIFVVGLNTAVLAFGVEWGLSRSMMGLLDDALNQRQEVAMSFPLAASLQYLAAQCIAIVFATKLAQSAQLMEREERAA